MAKKNPYKFLSKTDIKVFILFLLDTIRYPIDRSTLMKIMYENIESISIDFEECLVELVADKHIYLDAQEEESYYMISESGRFISAELYDMLDETFRERVTQSVMRHLTLQNSDTTIFSEIREREDRRFEVFLCATDNQGERFSLTMVTASREEAERIRDNYETRPDSVYRGILFSATGRIGYLN